MLPSKDTTKLVLAFYGRHIWKYPKKVIGLLLAVPLTILAYQLLPALIVADVIGKLGTKNYDPNNIWSSFGSELAGYAVLIIFGTVIGWRVIDRLTWRMEADIERNIAEEVFDHLLKLDADFHANNFGGSLVSYTNKIMGSYVRMADTTIYQVLPLLAGLIFSSIILAPRAPLFVVVLVFFALFYMTTAFFVTRPVRLLGNKHASQESIQTGFLADAVTNIMAIKSFARRDFENQRFAKATRNTRSSLFDFMQAHQKQQIYFHSLMSIISAVSLTVAVISVAVYHINLSIISYTSMIVSQLIMFSNSVIRNYYRSFGDASDMVKILQLPPQVADPLEPEALKISEGNIEFDNVTFTHAGANDAIFHRFTIQIKSGEKVGLVGHSGSGKTTFTRLLLRFSDIDSGAILIDGQNIAAITQEDLRSKIAYVPQEPLLFHRSIGENIGYGKTDATKEEIEQAAKHAHAHEFVKDLPDGYKTMVGERGIKLSGGQRQRVAIARALLKDAPILVLDEATSALDSESEKLIQDALWKLMEGRTAIAIAHRLSTIQRMDRIVVLDNGEIVEQVFKRLLGRWLRPLRLRRPDLRCLRHPLR
jgi:ATP-binding cassette subfamily B protein